MKRPFQFSLRALFILVSLTAVVFSVISWLLPETRLRLLGWALGIVILLAILQNFLEIASYPIVIVALCYERFRRLLGARQNNHPPYED